MLFRSKFFSLPSPTPLDNTSVTLFLLSFTFIMSLPCSDAIFIGARLGAFHIMLALAEGSVNMC